MKHYKSPLFFALLCMILAAAFLFSGCAPAAPGGTAFEFEDSAGNTVALGAKPVRVITLSSSLADLWFTAGGEIVGVTDDINQREFEYDRSKVESVGALMGPSAEKILSLQPDLLLYSPDIPAHKELVPTLAAAGVTCCAVSVDTFGEYLSMLKIMTTLTGREDLYEKHGQEQQEKIDALLKSVPEGDVQSILFLRAFSSGVKALATGHVVCDILEKANTVNIAASDSGLLKDLSLEAIVRDDPDTILVITMGEDAGKAMESLRSALTGNPAWAGLTAVKEERFVVLPKDLFQYKPNKEWSRAYEYLLQVLYPETYGTAE